MSTLKIMTKTTTAKNNSSPLHVTAYMISLLTHSFLFNLPVFHNYSRL